MKQMTKCRYANKYKAIKAPKCGCDYCILKWEKKQAEKKLAFKLREKYNDLRLDFI